uniref:Uncharacterized protein n=1 Tax=Cacopsylla melanoneura TaxID=428564 RepID=A0A8D8W338_9HEMI
MFLSIGLISVTTVESSPLVVLSELSTVVFSILYEPTSTMASVVVNFGTFRFDSFSSKTMAISVPLVVFTSPIIVSCKLLMPVVLCVSETCGVSFVMSVVLSVSETSKVSFVAK